MRRAIGVAACMALAWAGVALATPFWGAKQSAPADTAPADLKPGEFVWRAATVPSGPMVVVVSLGEQRAYVYRNGVEVGVSTVSTGKSGHRTPTGVFTVLQKDEDHRSRKYDDAPMPYSERLTWDGVALHAGGLPGYPSSHGCIHLPSEFARQLFEISPLGMTVVVADDHAAPQEVEHPAVIAPVDPRTGQPDVEPRLGAGEDERWEPEKSPDGPVAIVLSGADRRALVLRNGVEIGRARLTIRDPELPLGTHAFVLLEGARDSASLDVPGAPATRWSAVTVPGPKGVDAKPLDPTQVSRTSLPPRFAKAVSGILAPGATLLVTDAPVLEETTGVALSVLASGPPVAD
jgi:hypothetical protein